MNGRAPSLFAMHPSGAGTDWDDPSDIQHLVHFYQDDGDLLEAIRSFVASGLVAGGACVAVATAEHCRGLESRLAACGVPVRELCASGRLVLCEARELLSQFMEGDLPNRARFMEVVGGVVERAAGRGPGWPVRVFGEMVDLLWAEQKPDAALALEQLWNDLAQRLSFFLFCAYPIQRFQTAADSEPFRAVCDAHSRVLPLESRRALADRDAQLRALVELQQRAHALESELEARKRAEEDLRRREQELSDFMESAVEGLHRVGPDGIILWANRAELALLGYEREEYVGRHIAEFHADAAAIDDILKKLLSGVAIREYPAQLRCKDGSVKHVRISSSSLIEDGRFICTRCFTRDVTEQVRLDEALQVKLCEVKELNRRKDEFLAVLGHELRNPLAAVHGAVISALADEGQRDRALHIARRQVDQLKRLIDDLLDVTRITRGQIALRKEALDLALLVERAVEAAKPLIDHRRHELSVQLAASGVAVEADAARMEQVIVNLLSNAVKYTPPGGRIELVLEQAGAEAVLRITDSGIGIAPEMLSRIFEMFTQVDQGLDRAAGGLGLGLAIARQIAELHGGFIRAYSRGLGTGSEFTLRMPVLAAKTDATRTALGPAPSRAQGIPKSEHRARVFVVEDNPDGAAVLAMLLRVLGHEVESAVDGRTALAAAAARPPDVMLIDIGLPDISGYEVARQLRAHPALRHVVLAALTGYGRSEDREKAHRAGFDYHLVKPVEADAIIEILGKLPARPRADDSGGTDPGRDRMRDA